MKKALLLIAGLALAAACQTIQPMVDEAAACIKAGREWAGPGDCREKPKPEPIPEPGPEPSPGPTPQPEPVPAPGPETPPNDGWITVYPGDYIETPYTRRIEFLTRGIDWRQVGAKEWHLFDFSEQNGGEVSNAHFMIFGKEVRIIKQTYRPKSPEQHSFDEIAMEPGRIYHWVVEVDLYGFKVRILQNNSLIVDFGAAWNVPFKTIDRVRIGAGTFGVPYVALAPVEIRMAK